MDIDKKINCTILAIIVFSLVFVGCVVSLDREMATKLSGTWAKESNKNDLLEFYEQHMVHRVVEGRQVTTTILKWSLSPSRTVVFINGENASFEIGKDRLMIGAGKYAGIYYKAVEKAPEQLANSESTVLAAKLKDLENKLSALYQKRNILHQQESDLRINLKQRGVRSSADLTTTKTKQLGKELAEVVLQAKELQRECEHIEKVLDEGGSLQRRLAREELIGNGKISDDDMRKQLGELSEILSKLDEKFKNRGTINAQDTINQVVDEQLKGQK